MYKNIKSGISRRLMKNYIIMFIITTCIVIISFIIVDSISSSDDSRGLETSDTAQSIMNDNYENIKVDKIVSNKGGVQVVTRDLKVITIGGIRAIESDNITEAQWMEFLINSKNHENAYSYDISYNQDKEFYVIVTFPIPFQIYLEMSSNSLSKDYSQVQFVIILITLVYVLVFIISVEVYAKLSSRTFVKPIKELCERTKKLKLGDYEEDVTVYNISEFAELEDNFNNLSSQLKEEKIKRVQLENNKKNLILDISHDLKNPLTSIMGYAEVLLQSKEMNEEKRRRYIEAIFNNSIRANELITDLFEYSKLDSPNFILNKKETDICEFIREEICFYIPIFEEKSFKFDFDNQVEDECIINIDKKQMKRVFYNLFTNAVKYNEKGTKINTLLKVEDNAVIISVHDSGIGISCEIKDNIFEPFVRGDKVRNSKSGGTGLGLAIVKKIIEAHNGKIELFTEENKYSEFVITLFL